MRCDECHERALIVVFRQNGVNVAEPFGKVIDTTELTGVTEFENRP